MRPGAQPFLWKWVYVHKNEKSFPYERLSTYARFETEAQGNSEMASWREFQKLMNLFQLCQ